MTPQMKAAFIRIKCSSTPEVLQQLWDKRYVVLHYGNNPSLDPNDYDDSGKKSLARLHKYCEEGRIIGADFRELRRDNMLVGRIKPGSKVKAIKFKGGGEAFWYKAVELTDTVEVPYTRYPVLMALQPRQTTLTGWPSAQKALQAALAGKPLPRDVSSLDPNQLEVLCYEWLRMNGHLARLIMPIGRSMCDIDIFGMNDAGNHVYAQVTHSTSHDTNDDKLERLLSHKNKKATLFYFAPEGFSTKKQGIQVVPIHGVFSDLLKDEASFRMIRAMLGEKI